MYILIVVASTPTPCAGGLGLDAGSVGFGGGGVAYNAVNVAEDARRQKVLKESTLPFSYAALQNTIRFFLILDRKQDIKNVGCEFCGRVKCLLNRKFINQKPRLLGFFTFYGTLARRCPYTMVGNNTVSWVQSRCSFTFLPSLEETTFSGRVRSEEGKGELGGIAF